MLHIHRFFSQVNPPLWLALIALAAASLACVLTQTGVSIVPTSSAGPVNEVTPMPASDQPTAIFAPTADTGGVVALDARGERLLDHYAFDLYGAAYPAGIGPELYCMGRPEPPGGLYWTYSYGGVDVKLTEGAPLYGVVEDYRLSALGWCGCGLADESATASLTLPDGSTQPLEARVPGGPPMEDDLCASFEYEYDLDSPVGTYTVSLTNAGHTLSDTFSLSMPDQVSGLWVYSREEVWFGGLQPGELLTAAIFGTGVARFNDEFTQAFLTFGLKDEQPATADGRGLLRISLQTDEATSWGMVATISGAASGNHYACQGQDCGAGVLYDEFRALLDEYLFFRPDPATLPRIGNIRFCDGPCDANPAQTQFPAGIKAIHVAWDYENFQPGTPYTRDWASSGQSWVYYPNCTWQGPASGTQEIVLREPGGLRSGLWLLTLATNRVIIGQAAIELGEGHDFWEPAGVIDDCPDW